MAKIPTIIPFSDLRQRAARVLEGVRESNEPVFITQRGRTAAVLMSIDAYERAEARSKLLLLLARGETEVSSGISHDLAGVMAVADALLANE